MTIWPLLLDLLVAALLVATIVYAVRLNKRLAVLRDDRAQLQEMIKGLQKATGQAEEAVGGLRLSAADAGRSLHDVVERAQSLKSDLMFITEKADGAADRLEAVLKAQREAPAASAPAGPSVAAQAASVEARRRPPRVDVDGVAADAKGAQSRLSSLLKQAEAQQASPSRPAASPPPAAAEEQERAPQSRAERDLLRALEGRR
jgi:chromosome segregation ATPase